MNLAYHIYSILIKNDVKYSSAIRTIGSVIHVDIKFFSEEAAEEFALAWAMKIYKAWDGEFKIKMNYLHHGEFIPLTKIYLKAGPAPELPMHNYYQRPEKRLPFY